MRRSIVLTALAPAVLLAGCASPSIAPPVQVGTGLPPVLDAITQRTIMEGGFPVVIPEFHFHDADGDVEFLARELVSTTGPYDRTKGAAVTLPAAMQVRGAIFAGRWPCGPNAYQTTLRAYLVDHAGNRSNVMAYTIHCNGG